MAVTRWTCDLGSPVFGIPVVAEDRIAVALADERLAVIDRADGELEWCEPAPVGMRGGIEYDRFVLLWGGRDKMIWRTPLDEFNPASGADLPWLLECAPVRHPNRARTYVAGGGSVACISGNYLDILWTHDGLSGSGDTAPCTLAMTGDSTALLFGTGALLTALDAMKGTPIWQMRKGSALHLEPADGAPLTGFGTNVQWLRRVEDAYYYATEAGVLGCVEISEGS